jgi:signal transduction histidine kinase
LEKSSDLLSSQDGDGALHVEAAPPGGALLDVFRVELEQQNEELRHTRQELAASLRRYSDLYELAPVGLLSVDHAGRIARLNRRARDLLGARAQPGLALGGFVALASQASLSAWLAAKPTQTPSPFEAELSGSDGRASRRVVEFSLAPDEGPPGERLLALTDVTALHRTQKILDLSNRIARIGYWQMDFDQQRLQWSEVVREIHGVPADCEPDFESAIEFCLEGTHRDRLRAAVRAAIDQGEAYDLELQIRSARGEPLWVRTIGIPEQVEGRCRRLYGTVQDIDLRVRLEQARLAQIKAEAANRAKSAFMARMSHELRTPLTAVLGFAELLAYDAAVRASPTAPQQLQQMHRAGEHLLALIDDLLDLARVEAGGLRLKMDSVDLQTLAREAAELVETLARGHGVSVRIASANGALRVQVDRTRARQVVANILTNAVKYNQPGGTVEVTLYADEAHGYLVVGDPGCDMAPGQLEALYQPFNHLGAEQTGIDDAGLGLTITRQLVSAMGGRIAVLSLPGQGLMFTVSWPRSSSVAGTSDTDDGKSMGVAGPAEPARTHRVVYVEDNLASADVVRHALRLRPHLTLQIATDGPSGLEAIRLSRPSLVLIDLDLPGIGGLSLLRELRRDPQLAQLTFVAVSAHATADRIEQARAAGFDDYLVKPFGLARLFEVVDRVCR